MRCKIYLRYFCGVHYLSVYNVDLFTFHSIFFKQFYLKTGQCKFGATCKFHHPKDIQIPSANQENKAGETGTAIKTEGTGFSVKAPISFTPALLYNTKELPVRPVMYL